MAPFWLQTSFSCQVKHFFLFSEHESAAGASQSVSGRSDISFENIFQSSVAFLLARGTVNVVGEVERGALYLFSVRFLRGTNTVASVLRIIHTKVMSLNRVTQIFFVENVLLILFLVL